VSDKRIGQGMGHGAIATDAPGKASAFWEPVPSKRFFDASAGSPAQTLFQAQDLFAHDVETEVHGLDDAGVDRSDGISHTHSPSTRTG
jgi:hypothetical protein